MNKDKFKGFAVGVLVTLLLMVTIIPVGAAAINRVESIKVAFSGIKMYVDGKLIIPTDSNGKVVEPFIYDGTTYLPVRALSNALSNNSKDVAWNVDTKSIYIGQSPVAAQTPIELTGTFYAQYSTSDKIYVGESSRFTKLDQTIQPFNAITTHSATKNGASGYHSSTYLLKSNYSKLKASFDYATSYIGNTDTYYVEFLNVSASGEETLIKRIDMIAWEDAKLIDIDLLGVETLKIKMSGNFNSPHLYNIVLEGIN